MYVFMNDLKVCNVPGPHVNAPSNQTGFKSFGENQIQIMKSESI